MKRTLLFFILFLSVICVFAQNNPESPKAKRTELYFRGSSNPRPQAPQHSCIWCEYTETKIEIEIPADIEYLTVTITEKGCVIHESVVAIDEPVVQTDLLPGRYGITCTTPEGVCYQGDLVL